MVIVAPAAVELATAWPTRLICRVRQPEVLYPHHENDIIPVVLQKPDDHWTLAVAFHAGHLSTDIEWHAYPAHRSSIWACVSPPITLAASGTYSHVQSLMQWLSRPAARSG